MSSTQPQPTPRKPATASILVVEDRQSLRKLMQRALEQEGHAVIAAASGEAAIEELDQRRFDVVLTDLKLAAASGLDVLKATRERQPDAAVVVMTAYGTVRAAVEAMKLGAIDFLEKPVEIDDLFLLVDSLVRAPTDRSVLEVPGGPRIIGRHVRMRAAFRLLERVAVTDSNVLLTGESGTGKELFARGVHGLSPRRSGPFVAVNCAAIPALLMENELFGHEKGAFTGADRRQAGRFEQASGGTVFLDEIGELEFSVQSKILRVLEERTFERVGGGKPLKADVRLVAATNRDLKSMVDEGTFRSDLFFRLDVFPIELPPLRERADDIPLIATELLAQVAQRLGRKAPALTSDAEELLMAEAWPGNVRQLANVLERSLILEEGDRLTASALSRWLTPTESQDERQSVRRALSESDGDKRRAAELLGVSYRTLLKKVKEYDLQGYPKYRD